MHRFTSHSAATAIHSYSGRIQLLERQLAATPLHHIVKRVKISRELRTLRFIESNPTAYFA